MAEEDAPKLVQPMLSCYTAEDHLTVARRPWPCTAISASITAISASILTSAAVHLALGAVQTWSGSYEDDGKPHGQVSCHRQSVCLDQQPMFCCCKVTRSCIGGLNLRHSVRLASLPLLKCRQTTTAAYKVGDSVQPKCG